ncbi:MAG: PP2C family protein-serine/threonine phosphatase, partial [Coriobacteriia bacterium]|nr:PP2C family protein-serine/threonine phosphatase [Coriobacteriia bacterium]
VLAEINRMIAETGRTSDIVTLWVGLLDVRTGRLRYANGGHPPALVRTAVADADRRLATTGPLLGALMGAEYDEAVTELRLDEIVLLYTDGVTEARRGNKFFGEGRVRRALNKAATAAEAVDGLLSALDVFVPGNLRDDAAILAIRLREQEKADAT